MIHCLFMEIWIIVSVTQCVYIAYLIGLYNSETGFKRLCCEAVGSPDSGVYVLLTVWLCDKLLQSIQSLFFHFQRSIRTIEQFSVLF